MEKKTECPISSSVNEEILEIILTDTKAGPTFEKMKKEIEYVILTSIVKNVLIDYRTMKGRPGLAETYEIVRSYHSDIYKTKLAIVDLIENEEYQKFHETTSRNAGLSLKCFTDIDEARAWLRASIKRVNKVDF